MPVAIITGVTGQDGSYLAEFLHARGYEVHGVFRREQSDSDRDFDALPISKLIYRHQASITDRDAITRVIASVPADECYHLAAHTFAGGTDDTAVVETNTFGTCNVLQAIREYVPACRVFFAGSSEMFGRADACPQTENTPMRPDTLYGVSKVAAFELVRFYRQFRNLHVSCGFLYNHESPRRGRQFVTRKITSAVACIHSGLQNELRLGNLDARRDWGHARDYVRAMWLMLQQPAPDDYVIATGELHSVRDFVEAAFDSACLHWHDYVTTDPELYRPARSIALCGDAQKARKQMGWSPEYDFPALVGEMVDHDMAVEAQNMRLQKR